MDEKIQVCPYCGREVTPGAETCRYCGRPVVIRARGAAPASTIPTTPTARPVSTSTARTNTPADYPSGTPATRPSKQAATRKTTKEGSGEPVNKRKRMLHLSILFILLAIILYGTYELLG